MNIITNKVEYLKIDYHHLYVDKFENLDKMDKFPGGKKLHNSLIKKKTTQNNCKII